MSVQYQWMILGICLLMLGCTHRVRESAPVMRKAQHKEWDIHNGSSKGASDMKWNNYLKEAFGKATEIRIFEINKPGNIGPEKRNKELLSSLSNAGRIQEFASIFGVDEQKSGKYRSACVPYVSLELIIDNQDIRLLLLYEDSVVPKDENGLYLTEESKMKLKKWFVKNIDRLPYGWETGCGEE